MFSAKLVNRFSGTSKKTGNPYYSVDLFVDIDNRRILYKGFIPESVFNKIKDIPLDSEVAVMCGINGYGNLCIADIKKK